MADVTRVLSMLSGRLWRDELFGEVNAFRETLQRAAAFSNEELDNSIKALKAMNIVTTQEGIMATFEKPKRNLLVGLVRTEPLENSLRFDSDLRKYKTIASSYLH